MKSCSNTRGVPVTIFIVLLLLVYRGGLFIDDQAGGFGFDSELYGPYKSRDELRSVIPPVVQPPNSRELGERIFHNVCSVCHGSDGSGYLNVFPPLAKSDWVQRRSPDQLIAIVLNGLQGPIKVNGESYDNTMIGLGVVLTDQEIAAVLNFVRSDNRFGHGHDWDITPEQVSAVRAETESRNRSWTAVELLQIP